MWLRAIWALWLAGVICGSLISGNDISSLEQVLPIFGYDKVVHFGAYAGLGLLSIAAFGRSRGWVVAICMIPLGAVIEAGQHFSPERTPDVGDAIANALGVLSGIGLGLLINFSPPQVMPSVTIDKRRQRCTKMR
jgi:hypothetical protein